MNATLTPIDYVQINAGTKDGRKMGGASSGTYEGGEVEFWNESVLLLKKPVSEIVNDAANHDELVWALSQALPYMLHEDGDGAEECSAILAKNKK